MTGISEDKVTADSEYSGTPLGDGPGVDEIFWKLLSSQRLLEDAARLGISIVVRADTYRYLRERYGDVANSGLNLVLVADDVVPSSSRANGPSL